MAFDYLQNTFSMVAGATFSTSDLYRSIEVSSSGFAVIAASSQTAEVIGTLYSVTATTNGDRSEAVQVGYGPVVRARLAGSTLSAGNTIGWSSAGLGIAPTSDAPVWGVILAGSSGSTGRIVSVARF